MGDSRDNQNICLAPGIYLNIEKHHLRHRGFRRDSSLQAAWDTLIARTTGFIQPHEVYVSRNEGNKNCQLWNSGSVHVPGVYRFEENAL